MLFEKPRKNRPIRSTFDFQVNSLWTIVIFLCVAGCGGDPIQNNILDTSLSCDPATCMGGTCVADVCECEVGYVGDTCTTCDEGFVLEGESCVLAAWPPASCQLEEGRFEPSNYSIEILQPRPDLSVLNRFYKAYPGLAYNVRAAVIGGSPPYCYRLIEAPPGMVIDTATGEINWPEPAELASPYSVTLEVIDQEASSTTVNWNITVTTTGFRFVDAVNGTTASDGGTGTLEDPWRNISDWYEGADAAAEMRSTYAGEFLYYRGGTYLIDGWIDANNDNRFLMRDGAKPLVWLAYPGETPVIDFNDAYINIWGADNAYFDGFDFNVNGNTRGMGFVIPANANHVTYRKNRAYGITTGFSGGNNAHVFLTKVPEAEKGRFWSFQDNEFYDVNNGYGILGYSAERALIEDNTAYDISGHAIGPKQGTQMWFIRRNTFYSNDRDSVGVQYYDNAGILSGDIEISYNLVKSGGGMVRINSGQVANGLPVYVYRNTIIANAQQAYVDTTNGPFYWTRNVIVNDESSAYPDRINTQYNFLDPSRLLLIDNLTGGTTEGIVDDDGLLSGASRDSYLGTRGHEIP